MSGEEIDNPKVTKDGNENTDNTQKRQDNLIEETKSNSEQSSKKQEESLEKKEIVVDLIPDLRKQKDTLSAYLDFSGPAVSVENAEDSWCLVASEWLKAWKMHVGFKPNTVLSAKPGPVDNSHLLKSVSEESEAPKVLRPGLCEGLDYVLLPEEAFNLLVSWYGLVEGQGPIVRKATYAGFHSNSSKVEVYPLELVMQEFSHGGNRFTHTFNGEDTLESIEEELRSRFSVADVRKVRLWTKFEGGSWYQLQLKGRSRSNKTLNQIGLVTGKEISFEIQSEDGIWPSTDRDG